MREKCRLDHTERTDAEHASDSKINATHVTARAMRPGKISVNVITRYTAAATADKM